MKRGSKGPEVEIVQRRLRELGFPPGVADGQFGPGTEAAVLAFQRSAELLADGIIGPRTAAALGFNADMRCTVGLPCFPATPCPLVTVEIASAMFPAAPLANIARHLPVVLDALWDADLTSTPIVLCALATIRAETAGFAPIAEQISRYNTSAGGRPFDLYDNRRDLGNTGNPDGMVYRGRGFIQLTGRANYARFGKAIGVPELVNLPDQANDPGIAAQLLAAFIKAHELALKSALLRDDLPAARRLVNGGSHGLAAFTDAYRTGQRELGMR